MKKNKKKLQGREVGTRVYILGGCNKDGIGANCKVIEVLNSDGSCCRIMVDSGVKLSNAGKYDTTQADISSFLDKDDVRAAKPLDAVFLTHAHADHIDGLLNFFKMGYRFPTVYTGGYTKALLEKFMYETGLGRSAFPEVKIMKTGDEGMVELNHSMKVKALNVSHTASDSLGFYIASYVDGRFDQGLLDLGDFHTRKVLIGDGFNQEEFSRFVNENKVTAFFTDSTSLMSKKERGKEPEELIKNIEDVVRSQVGNQLIFPVISRSNELLCMYILAAGNAGRSVFIRGDVQGKAFDATQRSVFFCKGKKAEEQKLLWDNIRRYVHGGDFANFVSRPLGMQAIFVSGAFGDKKVRSDGMNMNSQYINITEGQDMHISMGKNVTFVHGQREIKDVDPEGHVASGKEKANAAGCVIIENEAEGNKYISAYMQESGHCYPGELENVLRVVYESNPEVMIVPEHGSRVQRRFAMNVIKRVTRNITTCDNGAYLFAKSGISPLVDFNKSQMRFVGSFSEVIQDGRMITHYDVISPSGSFIKRIGEYAEPSRDGNGAKSELKPKYKKILEMADELQSVEKIKHKASDPKKKKKSERKYDIKAREIMIAEARKHFKG